MGFRQTYKGIFQFKDQQTLEVAMAENQAEAMMADAMGLQDSFRGEGVMLIDIDAVAGEQDWEEMGVAVATLAMHASKGFAYTTIDRQDGSEVEVEYYEASGGGDTPVPVNSPVAPPVAEDYLPMSAGSHFVFRAKSDPSRTFDWTTHKHLANGREYFYFKDTSQMNVHFNDYWDGTFYYKNKSLVGTVAVGTTEQLDALSTSDPYASQIVYNSQGKLGDMLYTIWKQSDVFVVLTQQEFRTVEVPFGTFEDCMSLRVELFKVGAGKMDKRIHRQYFAKGIGLIKWEVDDESLELVDFTRA